MLWPGFLHLEPHMATFHCPLCQGPLAAWVVRDQFTCHHCSWALRSNCGHAILWALGAGLIGELALLAILWILLPGKLDALIVWFSLGCVAGYLLGYFTFRVKLILLPLRPQRPLLNHSGAAPPVSAELEK